MILPPPEGRYHQLQKSLLAIALATAGQNSHFLLTCLPILLHNPPNSLDIRNSPFFGE